MVDTLIVADDLTGAADCAIASASAGADTMVVIDRNHNPQGASVVSVDVNTRSMGRREAELAVAGAVRQFYARGTRILYQKMDSTLRGHWPSETRRVREAAAEVLGYAPLAIVAPAFPGTRRATVEGRVFVDGTPLEETEIYTSAGLTGSSDLRARLKEVGLNAELAGLQRAALGAEALRARLLELMEAGCEAAVCDAGTEEDLIVVAAASLALPRRVLWVGSAGLMRALVSAGRGDFALAAPSVRRVQDRPILVVVGSARGVSRAQFEALAQEPSVRSLIIPVSLLRRGPDIDRVAGYARALEDALSCACDIAVTIEADDSIDPDEGPRIAAALAELVAPRLADVGGAVMTGGETARAILVRGGVPSLKMLGEIEPGVAVGVAVQDVAIPVITKAGAFGDRNTLIRCRAALRGGESGRSDRAADGLSRGLA
jgi:uncharacterized protein YgbK (DUF1537 family)